jgi:hypothetical protein
MNSICSGLFPRASSGGTEDASLSSSPKASSQELGLLLDCGSKECGIFVTPLIYLGFTKKCPPHTFIGMSREKLSKPPVFVGI